MYSQLDFLLNVGLYNQVKVEKYYQHVKTRQQIYTMFFSIFKIISNNGAIRYQRPVWNFAVKNLVHLKVRSALISK